VPLSFHPNCSYLLTGSCDRTLRMWSVTEGRCVRLLTGHKGAVTSLQVSPCGRMAASAGEDKRIKIWDLAEGKWIKVKQLPVTYQYLHYITYIFDSDPDLHGSEFD
jgi:WD40 repeat protein